MASESAFYVRSAGEAVARIAFAASDVVLSVQPSLHIDSEFSSHLRNLNRRESKAFSLVAGAKPEVLHLRHNVDPLLSAFEPLKAGKFVAATAPSSILLPAIPHLYKLAQYPVVIHIALNDSTYPDYSEITAIRQCGFTFLQSETLQETQDIALTAHALAIRSGKGVIHFFDVNNLKDDRPIEPEKVQALRAVLDSSAIQAFHQSHPGGQSLYADEGHLAEVLDAQPSSAAGQVSIPDSPTLARRSSPDAPPQTGDQNSTDSSHRGSSIDSGPTESSATSAEAVVSRPVSSEDILGLVRAIWTRLESVLGRSYHPFEVSSAVDKPESALFIFGSTGIFVDELRLSSAPNPDYANVAIITARLYRPWISGDLKEILPSSLKRIAVLEQIRRKTTKWGPVMLDLLMSLRGDGATGPLIVGHQLGYLEKATARQALRGILQNLNSTTPMQNLEVGSSKPPHETHGDPYRLIQPEVENSYMKILNQVFGSRLYISNRLDSADAGISHSVATSPEFGFGSLLARIEHRKRFETRVQEAATSNKFITGAPSQWLSKWSLVASDRQKSNDLAPEVIARLNTDGSQLSRDLLDLKAFFFGESQWLIGSDAWAYDLANSGVHHVIASGANVNMLVIDSQPYSARASADPTRRKKDIGLYAMNYGNAYVASVAVYGSYTQVLEAMIEADRFEGPSVVVAYLPYNKEDDSPVTVLQETKKAVDSGYWPLYRWNPHNEEKGLPDFQLDSERIKKELEDFLSRENRLTQLMQRHPTFASNLSDSYGTEVRALQKKNAKEAYQRMVESLYGAPMTVLYASDNSNAENLAKRLGNRGKARGLKTIVMAMDDYPIEDLSTEENVVLLTSTAGQGEFPQNGRAFWDALKQAADLDLSKVHTAVFALGDSHYWPRKEDKIYYNKPGKDLDARLNFLGSKPLTEIGLGDDQDPDAYQTGYAEWEPKLWRALGVDNIEGLPEEPKELTNEDIKIESNFLRGTIVEGLADKSTGAISASDAQLTKFHGTYMQDDRDLRDERKAQGLEPAYSFMIRCRLNGGVATPSQWLQMDAISSKHGNETMKLTTRQTFQFHGVVKGKLKPAMRDINKALMTTLAACGDVNRNVMVSVLPKQSSLHAAVHKVSAKIADHLLPATSAYHEIWIKDTDSDKKEQIAGPAVIDQEPLYGPTYLPRKFKITMAIPPHNDTDVYAHDIGLIAICDSEGELVGFNFLVGGGMGVTHNNKKTYPRTGSMLGFFPTEKTHIVCEKIMLVQKDNGSRENRKHARLKYTIDDMGVDVFKGKVEDLLGAKFEEARPFTFESNIDTFGWQKDENGLNHFLMFIENGRVEDTPDYPMKTGLSEIAKTMKDSEEFRLTGNQHLCISNISADRLDEVKSMLKEYKLDNIRHSGLRLSSSACVAFPTCGLAMAESERYLPELITKLEGCLEENGLARESIVMRMTGCPNGCARPWLAEVAFVGKAYGAYNMYLGGGYHGNRLNKLYRSSIQEEEILEIMKALLGRYARERQDGEKFGDFVIRVGVIKPTTEGRKFHEDVAEEDEE